MWIYGGVHNAWNPATGRPPVHRLWQLSHYQNVFGAWLSYFRSGSPEQLRWARIRSDHFMDIGTNNYNDGSRIHGRAGDMYHGKGFVPWGGESGSMEHFIDPSAFLLKYYLTGDRRGQDLWNTWFERFAVYHQPESFPSGASCESVRGLRLRDRVVSFGDWVEFYRSTWEPRALIYIADHSRAMLDVPFECTYYGLAGHPTWGDQWYRRYYDLTHDPRVVERMRALASAGDENPSVAAFVYQTTRESSYLTRLIPRFYDTERILYDDPGDRYHGYGPWMINNKSIWLQQAPYFLQALKDAGLTVRRGVAPVVYPGIPTNVLKPQNIPEVKSTRGFSDSSLTVLALGQTGTPLKVSISALQSYGDVGGNFYVLDGADWPSGVSGPVYPPFDLAQHLTPPTNRQKERQLFGTSYQHSTTFPLTFTLPTPDAKPYVLEARADRGELFAPFTDAPEAAFLQRRMYNNGCMRPVETRTIGRQLFYVSPVPPNDGAVRLAIRASAGKWEVYPESAGPTYYRVETESGGLLGEGSVFWYGRKKEAVIDLPGLGSPPPMSVIYTSAEHGPRFQIMSGAEELLLSTDQQHLRTIQAMLPVFTPADLACP